MCYHWFVYCVFIRIKRRISKIHVTAEKNENTRYIENKVREAFGFKGTPLKFIIRERKDK